MIWGTFLLIVAARAVYDGMVYRYQEETRGKVFTLRESDLLRSPEYIREKVKHYCDKKGRAFECESFTSHVMGLAAHINNAPYRKDALTAALEAATKELAERKLVKTAAKNIARSLSLAFEKPVREGLLQMVLATASAVYLRAGRTVDAFDCFQTLYLRRHAYRPEHPQLLPNGRGLQLPKVARHKLRHDLDQMQYLLDAMGDKGHLVTKWTGGNTTLVSADLTNAIRTYKEILEKVDAMAAARASMAASAATNTSSSGARSRSAALEDAWTLGVDDWPRLNSTWNRALYVHPTEGLSGSVLSRDVNWRWRRETLSGSRCGR